MKTFKYKCNKCGYEFVGDEYTPKCPDCASTDLKRIRKKKTWIFVLIGLIVVAAAAAVAWFTVFNKPAAEVESTSITLQYTVNDQSNSIIITVEGVDMKTLKNEYQLTIKDSQDRRVGAPKRFYKTASPHISIAQFEEGETYSFHFERVDKKPVANVTWKGANKNMYTRPNSPKAPEIEVSKDYDCETNTYIIAVTVVSGKADQFYLDGQMQTASVFYQVKPRKEPYTVMAVDATSGLSSDIKQIECKSQKAFHITEAQIQRVFDRMAKQDESLSVGDALQQISNGKNIPLAQPVDGCADLGTLLYYAQTNGIRYSIHATIESYDCEDKVIAISARRG